MESGNDCKILDALYQGLQIRKKTRCDVRFWPTTADFEGIILVTRTSAIRYPPAGSLLDFESSILFKLFGTTACCYTFGVMGVNASLTLAGSPRQPRSFRFGKSGSFDRAKRRNHQDHLRKIQRSIAFMSQ